MSSSSPTALILGAGINGAAIARELALNGVGVVLVDTRDISAGATAFSSRLIHGGLRYLEYGEFGLVRESLTERTRLLRLAPQFVRPLQLFVPVASRWGGMRSAPGRFLGRSAKKGDAPEPRGLWVVQMGLGLYDWLAKDSSLPRRAVYRVGSDDTPPFDAAKNRWACAYWDAQIVYPERFTLALIEDVRRLAEEHGAEFRVLTYCEAELDGRSATVRRAGTDEAAATGRGEIVCEFQPAAVINATGAWVDDTLRRLHVSSPRLMGGTKGSHILTHHRGLLESLAGRGVYAEAADGRPVFLLPFGEGTLIGTTDLPFEQPPETAVAAEEEIAYLLQAANGVFPRLGLAREDVSLHYSGVRPLPFADAAQPAAITRRHFLKEHPEATVPLYSVIGGKLTTCRSLAEETAAKVLSRLGREVLATTQTRPIPGGESFPAAPDAVEAAKTQVAAKLGYTRAQIDAVWPLCGVLAEQALGGESLPARPDDRDNLPDTELPLRFVRYSIQREWPRTLDDLIERRLLLHFHEPLTEACLRRLAAEMAAAGLLAPGSLEKVVSHCRERLSKRFGKRVAP